MNINEFMDYVDAQSNIHSLYQKQIKVSLVAQNDQRKPQTKWTDYKIDQEAEKLYREMIESMHQKLVHTIHSDEADDWRDFLNENEVLDELEMQMESMD